MKHALPLTIQRAPFCKVKYTRSSLYKFKAVVYMVGVLDHFLISSKTATMYIKNCPQLRERTRTGPAPHPWQALTQGPGTDEHLIEQMLALRISWMQKVPLCFERLAWADTLGRLVSLQGSRFVQRVSAGKWHALYTREAGVDATAASREEAHQASVKNWSTNCLYDCVAIG